MGNPDFPGFSEKPKINFKLTMILTFYYFFLFYLVKSLRNDDKIMTFCLSLIITRLYFEFNPII